MAQYLKEEDLQHELALLKADPKHSKERLSEMFILIARNMLRMPCFSSYSDLWQSDMMSNAIIRCLLYYKNFDYSLISKRTNKPVKAFAYFTEICFKAYIEVLNQKNRNKKLEERSISISLLDESLKEIGTKYFSAANRVKFEYEYIPYIIVSEELLDSDEFLERIQHAEKTQNTLVYMFKSDDSITIELFEKYKALIPKQFESFFFQHYTTELEQKYNQTTMVENVKKFTKMSEDELEALDTVCRITDWDVYE